MKVVPYDKKYKEDFIAMNTAWISEMFVMEPVDVAVLESFEDNIAKGAQVFFALDDEETVMDCCMISPLPNSGRSKNSVPEVCIPVREPAAPASKHAWTMPRSGG